MKNFIAAALVLSICTLTGSQSLAATALKNTRSLQDASVKGIYFDISLGDPAKLLFRLDLADRTLQQLKSAGHDPDVVLGFRAGASSYITKASDYVLEDEIAIKTDIQARVKKLQAKGMVVEQCAIAADKLDIQMADFLPNVSVVKNGYVSLIGYQAKGYSVVSMD